MKVGVKYCGGCNPRFDRVAAVRCVEKRWGVHPISPAELGEDYDVLLVVCGCTARCVGVDGFSARKQVWICGQADVELAVECLLAWREQDKNEE